MTTETPAREYSTKGVPIVKYDPSTSTFRDYDKKMMVLKPDHKYWKLVLTEKDAWAKKNEDGTNMYTATQIEEMTKTEAIAHSAYVLGSTEKTNRYTDASTSYEIRETLRNRFSATDSLGLASILAQYDAVIDESPMGCPDIWVNELRHFSKQIKEAGGTEKSEVEIVAHLINKTPTEYKPVITILMA